MWWESTMLSLKGFASFFFIGSEQESAVEIVIFYYCQLLSASLHAKLRIFQHNFLKNYAVSEWIKNFKNWAPFFLQISEVPTQSNRNDFKLWMSSIVIFYNFVPMLFGIFSFAILKFSILTIRYFNVRYVDPCDIGDKHISCSLFSISAI